MPSPAIEIVVVGRAHHCGVAVDGHRRAEPVARGRVEGHLLGLHVDQRIDRQRIARGAVVDLEDQLAGPEHEAGGKRLAVRVEGGEVRVAQSGAGRRRERDAARVGGERRDEIRAELEAQREHSVACRLLAQREALLDGGADVHVPLGEGPAPVLEPASLGRNRGGLHAPHAARAPPVGSQGQLPAPAAGGRLALRDPEAVPREAGMGALPEAGLRRRGAGGRSERRGQQHGSSQQRPTCRNPEPSNEHDALPSEHATVARALPSQPGSSATRILS